MSDGAQTTRQPSPSFTTGTAFDSVMSPTRLELSVIWYGTLPSRPGSPVTLAEILVSPAFCWMPS